MRGWMVLAWLAGCGSPLRVNTNDVDGDGYLSAESGGDDCNDADAAVHPGQPEACADGVDNDCDGQVDDQGVGSIPWYADVDGDGYGIAESQRSGCPEVPPLSGWSTATGDCDDDDEEVHPAVPMDGCDQVDSDCDGTVDEDAALATVAGTPFAELEAAVAAALLEPLKPTVVEICARAEPYVVAQVNVVGQRNVTFRGIGATDNVQAVFEEARGGTVFSVRDEARLVLEDLVIRGSTSAPAVVAVEESFLEIADSELRDNPGSGLLVDGGVGAVGSVVTVAVRRTLITGNGGPALEGGGARLEGGYRGSFEDVDFIDNNARNGGGLRTRPGGVVASSDVSLRRVVVADNTALETGGGIYAQGGLSVSIADCEVSGNRALLGAGMRVEDTNLDGTNTLFTRNIAGDKGGAMSIFGNVIVDGSFTIVDNEALEGGGVVVEAKKGQFAAPHLAGLTITGNEAFLGGGIAVEYGTFAELRDSVVSGNTASSFGGGAYLTLGQNSGLDVARVDFGSGSTDNDPNDVELSNGSVYSYGSGASFVCSAAAEGCN